MTRHLDTLHLQDWATPRAFFNAVHAVEVFTLDVCASKWNAKLDSYLTIEDDALRDKVHWWTANWCNPPFTNPLPWLEKAWRQAREHDRMTVCLCPCAPDTEWFNDLALLGRVRPIKGRLKFDRPPGHTGKDPGATFPQCLVKYTPSIVRGDESAGWSSTVDRRYRIVQPGRAFLDRYAEQQSWAKTA